MIEVELSAAEVPIDPGGTAQLTVTVTNREDHDDHIALEIEGIDVEWYALPVPTLNLAPGASQSARVLFKIARSSESRAETYPFVVRARSLESGAAGLQQATLVVKPYSSLQLELEPKRVASTVFHPVNAVEVLVTNLGNHEDTLELFASDQEDACTYEFEPERLALQPGHAEPATLRIEPKSRPLLATTRLYSYNVTARSVRDSFVSATSHGQVERRPTVSAPAAIVLLLAVIAATLLWEFRPKPVTLGNFSANPIAQNQGLPVTLSWTQDNAQEGYILPGNLPVNTSNHSGSVTVTPDHTTTYTLVLQGGGQKVTRDVTVTVTIPPAPVPPTIVSFTSSQPRIHSGDTVTLSWRVANASYVVLNPLPPGTSEPTDPMIYTSQQVAPTETTTYTLAIKGPGGNARKSVTVNVAPARTSIATIEGFHAKPGTITAGQTATLSWRVEGAATVDIEPAIGTAVQPHDQAKVTPSATTTYTLTATDNRGNPVTKSVTVTVKQPPPPPLPVTTPSEQPGTQPTTPGAPSAPNGTTHGTGQPAG